MQHQRTLTATRFRRWLTIAVVFSASMAAAGVVGATVGGESFRGGGNSSARLSCPGGMERHGHPFSENASVFPGDPAPVINVVFTVPDDGFLVEEVLTGTHTGTHLDAPAHFIEGARSVDELAAREFVWPAYVIDVRERIEVDPNFELTVRDVRRYERANGRIPAGAMVIIQTGFDEFFGTPDFLGDAPGFSGEAVQWMFDRREIGGTGSDTFGPDATSDPDFDATYTTLLNDGVALPGLRNLDALNVRGDLLMAPTVALADGSGYQTDPISCLERRRRR